MTILGVDIGGSGIKAALVDTDRGELISERLRVPTPESLLVEDVLPAVADLVASFTDYHGPLGVGFPAVVQDGVPRTPFTAHQIPGWKGYPVAERLSALTGRAVTMLNDADAAGIAEMRFGNGQGKKGVVIIFTLGTGIGSAMFTNGQLVPNCELSALYLRGHTEFAEKYAADIVRQEEELSWEAYAARLDEYLHHVQRVFSPRLVIIGGGISKKYEKFLPLLTVDYPVVPAGLRNEAGIIGAAIAVAEGWSN
ncbi:MAG: ROK family protein [Ardenticatenaceae bacterium]|nr:ROK family protein [Anaerolineales bacterium]MCB8917314.1 ROK family protein [Ardenticatenaceae bacterium]